MAKMGRPLAQIDWPTFEQLCHIQCTTAEIASFFRIAEATLYDRVERQYGEHFSSIYKRYSDGGKCSLRRMQLKLAQKNAAMCIWLGKQYLGQKDHEEKREYYPNDNNLDTKTEILKLKGALYAKDQEIKELKEKVDGLKPKAD